MAGPGVGTVVALAGATGGDTALPAPSGALHFQQTLTVSKLFAPHRGQLIRPARCAIRERSFPWLCLASGLAASDLCHFTSACSRAASRWPAEPSRTLRLAMNFAYSAMKVLPGG